jgi:phenylacetate-CoA ligase
MRYLRPNVMITTPSWSMTLAEAAGEAGFDPRTLDLKKVWLTGEGCASAFRDRVEKIWGATANFYYGSLECGCIGIECDRHDGYHATLAHVYVEIADPKTGKVLAPGAKPTNALAARLASRMEYATGLPTAFEFVAHLQRPEGKAARVVRE